MGKHSVRRKVVNRYHMAIAIYNILHPTRPQDRQRVNGILKLRSLYIRQETHRLNTKSICRAGTIFTIIMALWILASYLDVIIHNVDINPTYQGWNLLAWVIKIKEVI